MSVLKDLKIKEALRCPICKAQMSIDENGCGVLYCLGQKKHCYDFASGGYVNFNCSFKSNSGDSKQAVRARSEFLDGGYYAPVADLTCELLEKYARADGLVVDAGCGEGYYSNRIADRGFCVMGFDLSKFATDAAAKRAKRGRTAATLFGAASVFEMPVADSSADAVVNIFAPCVENEYARALDDNGTLIVVHAGEKHLLGLKKVIYEQAHENEPRADMPKEMMLVEERRLSYEISIGDNASIKALFAMTPYYWKTSKDDLEKLEGIERLKTEVDMIFSVYKK